MELDTQRVISASLPMRVPRFQQGRVQCLEKKREGKGREGKGREGKGRENGNEDGNENENENDK